MNYKKWLSFPKVLRSGLGWDEVLGLDIGSSSVKMVALRKDNSGYTVDAAAIAEIPTSDDSNQRKTNTLRAIHDCLKSAGTRRKLAVCGVSGPEVAVRDFEFPVLPAEEIPGAVKLEASQVCPFNAGDGAVDYQLIPNERERDCDDCPENEIKTKGILVAATNTLINNKIQFAKEAHLKCVLMDVDGLALLNCFNRLADEHEKTSSGRTTAILNAGASNMTIAIMGANGWPFIRDMAYAGDDIIEQIAMEKNMPTESVKEMLFGSAELAKVGNSQTDRTEFHYSLENACRKVTDDVAETLRFYSAQAKSTKVDRIFVCGGFALATGFVELLSSQLGIEAVFWNPFEKIRCEIRSGDSAGVRHSCPSGAGSTDRRREGGQYQDIFSERGSAMAVAVGLAMRSI